MVVHITAPSGSSRLLSNRIGCRLQTPEFAIPISQPELNSARLHGTLVARPDRLIRPRSSAQSGCGRKLAEYHSVHGSLRIPTLGDAAAEEYGNDLRPARKNRHAYWSKGSP